MSDTSSDMDVTWGNVWDLLGGNKKQEERIRQGNLEGQLQRYADPEAAARYWADQEARINEAYQADTQYYDDVRSAVQTRLGPIRDAVASAEKKVAGLYGAAASQGRQSAENIYRGGQETASAIDSLYGGAAARAAGAAAGDSFAGASGEMAYAPTTTRAYGSSIADYTGREANFAASDVERAAAQVGSGRKSIEDWFNDQNNALMLSIDMQQLAEEKAMRGNRRAAMVALEAQKEQDTITSGDREMALRVAEAQYDADTDLGEQLRSQYKRKDQFILAMRQLLSANSKRQAERWWSVLTTPESEYEQSAGLFGSGVDNAQVANYINQLTAGQ